METRKYDTMTVGGGCFWCFEAIFQQLKGVKQVVSGYSGGDCPGHPTYREVCSGRTGHAEVIQITYDSSVVSYEELLLVFMTNHDPTAHNNLEKGYGSQYRSVVFYHDDEQKEIAEEMIKQLSPHFQSKIVTEISSMKVFYEAEGYHQNYYNVNSDKAYCTFMIGPKLKKLGKEYADMLKPEVVKAT